MGIVVEPEPVATETGLWIPADAVARARATDAPAGVETLVVTAGEARSETTGPEAELALPSSGAPTLTAETRDAVGNLRTTDPVALQVDGAPPVVEIVLDGPQIEVGDRLIATPALVATVRATDIASGVATTTLSIDGGVIEGSSRSGGWQPGLHTLAASAEDRVGNRAEVSERRIEIDGDGPALSHRVLTHGVEGAEGQALYRPPVEVSIEATDGAGVESVQWSSDGTSWQDLAASGGTLGTPNPTIELRAVDGVGNTRRQTASWQLDSDPPRWVLRGPDGEVDPGGEVVLIQGQSVTLEAVDAAGVAHQETGLRARTWQTAPVEIRFPTRGRYWLGARSEDRLGNAAKVQWWVRVERQGGAR